MLDESILNLQITILLMLGTCIFIIVSFKRKDLILYLPTYILTPIGYFFIYLQIFNYNYRLLGNLIFLIGVLLFIFAVYYEYFKTIKKNNNATISNLKNNNVILSLSPITSLIIGIQLFFSVLIVIAIIMLIKLYFMKRSTKYASLIVFLAAALLSALSTILSYFQIPGIWELSFVAMIILSAIYFMFPIMVYLEERFANVGVKLIESEEKFRTIAEESMVGISIIQDKIFQYINKAFLDNIGYTSEEIKSWKSDELFEKIVHPDQREEMREISQKIESGKIEFATRKELKMIRKNGEIRWIDVYARSFIYQNRPAGMNISIDITERKKTEQKLRESEEKYRSLFENSPIALMDQDFSEIKIYINHLKASGINDFKKYFDDKPDEVIKCMSKAKIVDVNRKALEVYKANSKEDFVFKMNQFSEGIINQMTEEVFLDNKMELLSLINGNTMYESEIVTKTSTGDTISLYAKTSIVPGFENTWSKAIVSIIDITDRKIAEQRLKESEEKFRTITEQSFIGVLIEQDFDILYVNQRFSTIIGYSTEELLKWKLTDFYNILHPEDVDKFRELIDKKTKGLTDKITNFQSRLFKKTGEVIWVELFSREFKYQDRSANLAFVMDITDIKEAEEVIRKENKKLLELDNLRKELITRISHELRTPLTSIYGASQILLQSNKKDVIEKIWPYIEITHRGSIRLKELIDNLLDASRLDNKKFELRLSNENLNSLINDCIKELHYLADNRQLIINVDLPVNVSFKLDKHRFEQVLINILSNAIKNTPPHGQIFVILNETQDQIEVIIKDTGVGLTEDEKTKIFQKFGKIERYGMDLDVDIEGAGLGLYISNEIVKLHGGEILVESEGRNKGCTFIIRLYKLLDKLEKPD